ncbi:serine/threonine-protein phosphatase 5 isoform X3 [Bemisia tabaci]
MIVPEMKLDRRQCLSGTRCEAHEVNFIAIFTSLLVALSVSHAFSVERLNVEGTLDRISNSDLRSHREFETNYTGPVLENEKVTLKFMTDLLKFYNDCLIITSIEKPYSILPEKDVFTILKQARDYFKKQPSLVDIKLPKNENITVCGGIHGKLLNLVHIFSLNGLPSPKNRYLFNGDITGRRFKSIECLLLYFGFKLLYPDAVFINRGHKEDQGQNYGLDDLVEECRTKYPRNAKLLHGFWEVFQWMPLAHIISTDIAEKKNAGAEGSAMSPVYGRVLVTHGGMFPKKGVTLDDVKKVKRGCDPTNSGPDLLINDMLWSDWNIPEACRNVTQVEKNQPNITSQIGPDESKSFCEANKIDYIIRNFAPLDEGYCVEHNGRIVSLISTDEFTDTAKGLNKGALIVLESPGLIPKFTKFRFTFVVEEFLKTRIMRRFWTDEKDIPIGK